MKRIILSFRGSVTKKDYQVDFDKAMKQYDFPMQGEGKVAVHRGIGGEYKSIR